MTKQEILTRAIQKAKDGGWNFETLVSWRDGYGVQKFKGLQRLKEFDVEHIIYNHDFAKALWGEKPYYRFDGDTLDTPTQWQVHLQQMVISPDPIKYLGEHLE